MSSFLDQAFTENFDYSINLQLSTDNKVLYDKSIDKLKANTTETPDSGFDLFVPETVTIQPGEIKLIDMGVKCSVYKNIHNHNIITGKKMTKTISSPYYLYPRSSVSKRGIILANSVGIIDSGYRGSLMAAFYNTKKEPVCIKAGDRIVQICMPGLSFHFNIDIVDNLNKTARGEQGLGSTGK